MSGDAAVFSFLGDQPACDGWEPLGFDEIAGELAQLVLRSRDSTPFALGIEGAWGTGKSTLMGRLRAHLAEAPGVETVTFNAWTAAEDDVVEGLVKSVLDKLDPNAMRRALRSARLLSWARVGLSVAAGWLRLGSVVDLFWSKTAIDPQARNQMMRLVEESVRAWAEHDAGVPEGRLLCVVIDDLDRCSPRGAMEVLEAIKLYLSVPRVVFVVGYDQTIVSDLVLRERGYSEAIKGRDYLEKFVQIKYRVPRPSTSRSRALVSDLLVMSRTSGLFGDAELALLYERNQRNPRRIKRFINDFVLAYGMDPPWREFAPESLIRLQLLNAYFEEFARLLPAQEEPDPLDEFAEYREAREWLRRVGSRGPASGSPAAFERLGLPLPDVVRPDDVARLLRALEDELPVAFIALVDDRELCSLVDSLRGAPDWDRLRQRLLEREAAVEILFEAEPGGDERPRRLVGLSVLWVDDQPENNARLIERLRELGAGVEFASSTSAARAGLAHRHYDVLISDIDRDGDENAGLDALAVFQEESIAPANAVFFVARVTRVRRDRATQLGAFITASPTELFAQLEAIGTDGSGRRLQFQAIGADGDRELVERVREDLLRKLPEGTVLGGVAPDRILLCDALVVVVGDGWSALDAAARDHLARRLRLFAATGATLLFALTPRAPDAVVDQVAAIVAPERATPVRLRAGSWEDDVARLAEIVRRQVVSARRRPRRVSR